MLPVVTTAVILVQLAEHLYTLQGSGNGLAVGDVLGPAEGVDVIRRLLGVALGEKVGDVVGTDEVGVVLGLADGCAVGCEKVGEEVGVVVGEPLGMTVGAIVGMCATEQR